MEAVLEEALKSFVSDILSSDRPCSELSLKIFFIFKTIVGSHDHVEEEQIVSLVKTYLSNLPEIKEQVSQQDLVSKCVQILRGQILIRLFFIWVARECLKKDIESDPEMKSITDEIVKLCEMFCIRTDPLQLNAFLSDTVMRMFVDHVPNILARIFDEFLLPLPKELATAVGNEEENQDSPQLDSSKEPSFDDPFGSNGNKRRSREGRNSQPRHFVISPIKTFDNNSSAGRNMNRFGKKPSRQILVAARLSSGSGSGSENHISSGKNGGGKAKNKAIMAEKSQVNSADRRVGVRSQSFDHVGVGLRQAAAVAMQRQVTAPILGSFQQAGSAVRRCLFGDGVPQNQQQRTGAGFTTPRKRSAAVLMSVADTPPMENSKKLSKIAPMTPLSKNQENNFANGQELRSPKTVSSPFSKPNLTQFRVITTPLRHLQQQQAVMRSPMAPGTILVPQSPDDSKAGIAARSFYTKPVAPPQSIVQATRKQNIFTNSSRRTMSSYDFGASGSLPPVQPSQNSDTTHFLFTELVTMSPTTSGGTGIVSESSSIYGYFPPAESDISPRPCHRLPASVSSLEKSQQQQSALLASPVIESRASRRGQQHPPTQQMGSPFSVAAGYACE